MGSTELTRLSTIFERTLYNIANSLLLLLRGTPIILAGDEIGLKGTNEIEKYMQWDDSNGCGFTENKEIGLFLKNQTGCANSVISAIAHTTGQWSIY